MRDVYLVTGDTDHFHWGAGTFASRGAVSRGQRHPRGSDRGAPKDSQTCAEQLEVAEEDLELAEGEVRVKGVPETAIKLGQLAMAAKPLRGAVKRVPNQAWRRPPTLARKAALRPSGVHAMILEVDPETMLVDIQKYVVVHDCGTVINPLILDGQIHGGWPKASATLSMSSFTLMKMGNCSTPPSWIFYCRPLWMFPALTLAITSPPPRLTP